MLSNLPLLPSVRVPVFSAPAGEFRLLAVWAKQRGWHRRFKRSHIGELAEEL